jgi:hypothetical protein
MRRRSRRSYALELALTAAAVAALYLFLTNGGPSWFGRWLADFMT